MTLQTIGHYAGPFIVILIVVAGWLANREFRKGIELRKGIKKKDDAKDKSH